MPLSHPPVSADDDTTAAGVLEGMSSANATTRRRWVPLVLPPLVGMFALGLSYLYWQGEEDNVQAKNALNFEVAADQVAYNLKDRMATYEVVLRGVKGYFEGSERIDREEFKTYVEALQLQETRPGLQGVSLILHLFEPQLDLHIADMRRRGFSHYNVLPLGVRAAYAPITHIEPLRGDNVRALGFDTLTIPAAREALERARDSGDLALSAPLTLLQNDISATAAQPGVVMYLPIYAPQADTSTPLVRRAGLVGL